MPSSLPTPDNPGPRVDRLVAARPRSTYLMPTIQRTPEISTDNSISQIARGLETLNPALTKVAGQYISEKERQEEAEAAVAVQVAQAKNVEDLKAAQAKDLIPDGASPNYIRAWQTNRAKLLGEKSSQKLMEDYYANDAVRNSDDPQAFDNFVKEWREKHDTANLKAGVADGPLQFTAVELHNSGYFQAVDSAVAQVRSQHLNYRVSEREKQATNTASNLIQQRLDAAFDSAVDAPDLTKTAKQINDVFYNPVSGQVQYGGMRPSKANEILTEAIITKAIDAGDTSILDVANHIGPDAKASLANTKVFREKAEAARQHIATTRWMNEERDRKRAEYRGLGIENPDQVEERFREDRTRVMEQYAAEKLHRDQYAKQVQQHEAVEPELKAIVRLHALNGDTSSKEIRDSLKAIAEIDPDTYKSITTWLQTEARQSRTVDEKTALQTFTKLRASISDDPNKFDSREILRAANRGHISAGQVNELYGLVDSAKKTAREFPLMSAPLIQGLRSDLRGAVGTNPLDEFGVGRLRADQAAADLNGLIAGYLRSHPRATEYEVYEKLQPMVEKLARKHSPDLNESLTQQEQAQDPRRAQLEAQLKERYPNKAQREQVINQILQSKR